MSVMYEDARAQLAPGTRRLEISFRLANLSEDWGTSEADAVGCHLFDAHTGTLLVEGTRRPPESTVPLSLELPAEDGRYQVFVSPMREGECWHYQRGWPFLLVEASVENGAARIDAVRTTTYSIIRRRRGWRGLGRSLTYPILTVWRNRSLIRVMVRRDILGRYRGSFGGAFWTIFNPLLLLLTYFFVFGVVLRSRFGGDSSQTGFALYFLAGMLPWLAFSEAAGRAPGVMLEHRNFVKKLVFATETLPFNLVVAALVTEGFAIALYLIGLAMVRGGVPASALWLPALIVPQVLFTAGVCWLLAALGVFFRDLGQIIGFVLTLWFFLTPICYPEQSLPPEALAVLSKNPIFVLVREYRRVLLEGHAPALSALAKLWGFSAAFFVLGHALFYKLRKSFADII
jgi:lipopolysaccharide transport system permease protein